MVTGYGTVDGREICVFSQDVAVFGGSLGEVYGEKIVKVLDFALATGRPVVGINEGGGARIQEGVVSLGLYAEIFKRNVHLSGRDPADLADHGRERRRACLLPRAHRLHRDGRQHLADVHHRTRMSSGRSPASRSPSRSSAGPARTTPARATRTTWPRTRPDAIDYVQRAAVLPAVQQPVDWRPPAPARHGDADELTDDDLALDTLIPDSPNQPYDMTDRRCRRCWTTASSCRCRSCTRRTSSSASAGWTGRSVGVVANQPMHLAGTLDINAAEKAARFVRTCDAFNIPVLTFVDVPGFLPGTDQEWNGIIRRGAKLIYAYAEATVPLVTVITRKAYGGAYDVMGSKHLGADVNLAWPTAQIAVMGAAGRGERVVPQGVRRVAPSSTGPTAPRSPSCAAGCRPSTRTPW